MDYYKSFADYDSIATEGEISVDYNKPSVRFGLYMRLTKDRDSIWATICHTQWNPFYKRLDTCHSILTRML